MPEGYDVSVIVPVYNVEDYIRPCLDSLLRQGLVSLQVIMVDDGSTDNSGSIADEYAGRYSNFSCYHIRNAGQGNARNYGVSHAEGRYLAFLDSDDVLADHTYTRMLRMAERDRSDITICSAARFNSQRYYRSTLHDKVFAGNGSSANIMTDHSLLYDTCSTNKLIRRSFYLENDLKFPTGYYYEDIPFAIHMHLRAQNVSVMHDVCYLWRERESDSSSVTQKTGDLKNLRDRIRAIEEADRYIREAGADDDLIRYWRMRNLRSDYMIFCNRCLELSDDCLTEMLDIIGDNIAKRMTSDDLKLPDPILQRKYDAVLCRDISLLRRIREYEQSGEFASLPIEDTGDAIIGQLPEPIFGSHDADLTGLIQGKHLYANITNMEISADGLSVEAEFYKRRPDYTECAHSVQIDLYNELTMQSIPLETVSAGNGRVRAELKCDPGERIAISEEPYRLRYTIHSMTSNEAGFLRFRKKLRNKTKFPALLYEDRYISVEESHLRHPAICVRDNSLYLNRISPGGSDINIKLNKPGAMIKLVPDNMDAEGCTLQGLMARGEMIGAGCMNEGTEYSVFAGVSAGCGDEREYTPVLSYSKKLSEIKTDKGMIIANTLRTGVLRLSRCYELLNITDAGSDGREFQLKLKYEGGDAEAVDAASAELFIVSEDRRVPAAPGLRGQSGEWLFRVSPQQLIAAGAGVSKREELGAELGLRNGTTKHLPVYCTRKMSETAACDDGAIKLYRNSAGRIGIKR